MLGALLAFGVGVVAWRTRLLPRWLAGTSFLAGIGALASFTFITTLIYVAWILLLSRCGRTACSSGKTRTCRSSWLMRLPLRQPSGLRNRRLLRIPMRVVISSA